MNLDILLQHKSSSTLLQRKHHSTSVLADTVALEKPSYGNWLCAIHTISDQGSKEMPYPKVSVSFLLAKDLDTSEVLGI